jgi:hypothetical protein
MAKMYQGNMPDPADGWKKIGSTVYGGVEWFVWEKVQEHSTEWFNYKIVANGRAEAKANYWLSRNKFTGQIAFARDFAGMRSNHPELHLNVEKIINGKK